MPYGNFMGGQVADPSQIGAAAMAPGMSPGMVPPAAGVPQGPGPMGPPAAGQQPMIDPNLMAATLAMQSQQGRRNQVGRQSALANQLRADANAQLSGPRTGVANVGAAMMNGYMAGKQMREANANEAMLDKDLAGARQNVLSSLLRGSGGAAM